MPEQYTGKVVNVSDDIGTISLEPCPQEQAFKIVSPFVSKEQGVRLTPGSFSAEQLTVEAIITRRHGESAQQLETVAIRLAALLSEKW